MTEKFYPEYADLSWDEVTIPPSESRSNSAVALFAVVAAIACAARIVRELYQYQVAQQDPLTLYVAALAAGLVALGVLVVKSHQFRKRTLKLVLKTDVGQVDRSPIAITFTRSLFLSGAALGCLFLFNGAVRSALAQVTEGAAWLVLAICGARRIIARLHREAEPGTPYPEFADSSWSTLAISPSESRSNTAVSVFTILYAVFCLVNVARTLYYHQVAHQSLLTPYVAGLGIGFVTLIMLISKADQFRKRSVKLVLNADTRQIDRCPIAVAFTRAIFLLGFVIGTILLSGGYVTSALVPMIAGAAWLGLSLWGGSRMLDRRRRLA